MKTNLKQNSSFIGENIMNYTEFGFINCAYYFQEDFAVLFYCSAWGHTAICCNLFIVNGVITCNNVKFIWILVTDDCLEYGEFKYRCHTYPAHHCARAGKIGKARIRTLKMTLVIGESLIYLFIQLVGFNVVFDILQPY